MSRKAVATKNSPHLLLEIKCVMIKKLLLSVLAIFCFALVGVSSAYAESYQIDLDSSNQQQYGIVCGLNSGRSCDNFKYLTYNWSTSSYNSEVFVQYNTSAGNFSLPTMRPAFSGTMALPDEEFTSIIFGYNYVRGSDSVSLIFSDSPPFGSSGGIVPSGILNITENGTFDVTNYASAVVNVDQTISDLPPYSELVVDSFWKYHVAIAGGLASIFAIFVVYRIIRSRLR